MILFTERAICIHRTDRTPYAIFGELYLHDRLLCYTLEDPPGATDGKGPVPPGSDYRVVLSYSPRFRMLLPEILNIPGRENIRIHAGNTQLDTVGCVLVGTYRTSDRAVAESQAALGKLLARWSEWHGTLLEIRG